MGDREVEAAIQHEVAMVHPEVVLATHEEAQISHSAEVHSMMGAGTMVMGDAEVVQWPPELVPEWLRVP